jgi:predicted dinucleotide-utilizing enzyme
MNFLSRLAISGGVGLRVLAINVRVDVLSAINVHIFVINGKLGVARVTVSQQKTRENPDVHS